MKFIRILLKDGFIESQQTACNTAALEHNSTASCITRSLGSNTQAAAPAVMESEISS
jgi:hypothetical protein